MSKLKIKATGIFEEFFEFIQDNLCHLFKPKLRIVMTYKVKADNPDVQFVASADLVDSEGNVIEDGNSIMWNIQSSDSTVISVKTDTDGNTADGAVKFESPGTATVTFNAMYNNSLLGSHADNFIVTVGDPAAVANIAVSFAGLTPEPEEPV